MKQGLAVGQIGGTGLEPVRPGRRRCQHIERHRDRRCEQAKDNESASQHGASGLAAFSRPAFDRRTRGCATPRGDLAAGFDRALLHFLEAVGQSGREAIRVLVTSTAAAHNFWIFGFETCLILDRCRRCLGRRNEGIDGSIELSRALQISGTRRSRRSWNCPGTGPWPLAASLDGLQRGLYLGQLEGRIALVHGARPLGRAPNAFMACLR